MIALELIKSDTGCITDLISASLFIIHSWQFDENINTVQSWT